MNTYFFFFFFFSLVVSHAPLREGNINKNTTQSHPVIVNAVVLID